MNTNLYGDFSLWDVAPCSSIARSQYPPKRWYPYTRLHGVITQKTAIFIFQISQGLMSRVWELIFNFFYTIESFPGFSYL
jgi:hypothetical protein